MIRAGTDCCSPFALELCTCTRCGALLTRYDFGTDDLGRTLERCPKCGPALLQARRGAPVEGRHASVFKPRVIGKCADCPKKIIWRGTGTKPLRCPACRRNRGRKADLAAYHARQKRLA